VISSVIFNLNIQFNKKNFSKPPQRTPMMFQSVGNFFYKEQ
jgi:hypothetical protein